MITVFRSSKGGSGTSTITAALALLTGSSSSAPVLCLDLAGDLPAVFGTSQSTPGLSEWLTRETDLDIFDLCLDGGHGVHLLPLGSLPLPDIGANAWNRLLAFLDEATRHGVEVIVDAGTALLPEIFTRVSSGRRTLLVIRPCYLALRRAMQSELAADGIVLVTGGDRVLTRADVESVLRIPVLAECPLDPDVARRVDAGLFHSRLPKTLVTSLERLMTIPT